MGNALNRQNILAIFLSNTENFFNFALSKRKRNATRMKRVLLSFSAITNRQFNHQSERSEIRRSFLFMCKSCNLGMG